MPIVMASQSRHSWLPKMEPCAPSCIPHQYSSCLQALQWKSGRWGFFCCVFILLCSAAEVSLLQGAAGFAQAQLKLVTLCAQGLCWQLKDPPSLLPPSPNSTFLSASPAPLLGAGKWHSRRAPEQPCSAGRSRGASLPQFPGPGASIPSSLLAPNSLLICPATSGVGQHHNNHICTTGTRPACPQNKISLQERLGQGVGRSWDTTKMWSMGVLSVV